MDGKSESQYDMNFRYCINTMITQRKPLSINLWVGKWIHLGPTMAGQQWGSAEEFILQRRSGLSEVVYPTKVGLTKRSYERD